MLESYRRVMANCWSRGWRKFSRVGNDCIRGCVALREENHEWSVNHSGSGKWKRRRRTVHVERDISIKDRETL